MGEHRPRRVERDQHRHRDDDVPRLGAGDAVLPELLVTEVVYPGDDDHESKREQYEPGSP